MFKKCREDSEHILFIDASNDFDKAKNQNYLTDKHVEKIIDTYAIRETLEKYSYLAPIQEVKENDCNLNIPRYVDTFEEEELIDIDNVCAQLKDIHTEITNNDQTIKQYCDELGIATPF